MSTNNRFRRADASKYLLQTWGVARAPATLNKLASLGGGPPFQHFGRWPVYERNDLDAWVKSRLSRRKASTSDAGHQSNEVAA